MKPGTDPLSGKDLLHLIELINSCLSSKDEMGIEGFTVELGSLVPFDYALATQFSTASPTESYKTVNVSYPAEWLDLYISSRFDRIDPIIREQLQSPRPGYWDDLYMKYPDAGNFISLSRDFGLNQGYSCALKSRDGATMTLLSLSARSMKSDPRTGLILRYALPVLNICMNRVFSRPGSRSISEDHLSARELEILKWTRGGRDEWEISVILNIGYDRVKWYMKSILEKLDATDRAHAVAIAIERGLADTL